MLFPFEKTWVANIVRRPDVDAFVRAAAMFAHDGTEAALRRLEKVPKARGCAK